MVNTRRDALVAAFGGGVRFRFPSLRLASSSFVFVEQLAQDVPVRFQQIVVAIDLDGLRFQPVGALPEHRIAFIADIQIVVFGDHLLGARVQRLVFR